METKTDYLNTLGIGTGLKTKEIIESLVNVERQSRTRSIVSQQSKVESQISAYGELASAFSDFKAVTDAFRKQTAVGFSVNSSDTKVIDAKIVGPQAQSTNTAVTVTSLASRQILTRSGYADTTSAVGEGSLTIKLGTWSDGSFTQGTEKKTVSVSIGSSNNTLSGVAQALNTAFASAGVDASATVAKLSSTGTNDYMLMINGPEGAANGFEITATESGSAGLANLNYKAGSLSMTQSQAGSDAALTVNGVNFTRSSNVISDLLPGVELTVKTTSATQQTVSVSGDQSGLETSLEAFIEGYNSLYSFLDEATKITKDGEKGALVGETVAKTALRNLRSSVSDPIKGFNTKSYYLANLGVETNRDGSLGLNKAKFEKAYTADRSVFQALFTSETKSGSNEVKILSTNRNTSAGSYALTNVTPPTSTVMSSSSAATDLSSSSLSLSGSGSDNVLTMSINGIQTGAITVPTGTYSSGASLASALEIAINADANLIAGKASVKVAFNGSSTTYSITNDKLGAAGTIAIESISSALSSAFNMSTSSTAVLGNNAAGLMDGVSMSSSGNILTSASGSSEGLTLELTANAGAADIFVGNSVFDQLAELLSNYITSSLSDNSIKSVPEKIAELEARATELETETESVEDTIAGIEERYTKQFTALEQLSISLKSTSGLIDNLMEGMYAD